MITSRLTLHDPDFYIYLHLDINQDVFYVGKGLKQYRDYNYKRAHSKASRNKHWIEVANNGYTVMIHTENLSHIDALSLETKLIKQYGIDNLTNMRY